MSLWQLATALIAPSLCLGQGSSELRTIPYGPAGELFMIAYQPGDPTSWNPNDPFRRRSANPWGLEWDYRSLRWSPFSRQPGRPTGVSPWLLNLNETRVSLLAPGGSGVLPVGGLVGRLPAQEFDPADLVRRGDGSFGPVDASSALAKESLFRTRWVDREHGDETLRRVRYSRERDRLRDEAWSSFRAGRFRPAAHVFRSAVALSPKDDESRLGLVFCDVALMNYHTALVDLNAYLAATGPTALAGPGAMSRRFGSVEQYHDAREALRRFAQGRVDEDRFHVLLALFLWHSGDRREAIVVAESHAGRGPDSLLEEWLVKMRRAENPPQDSPPETDAHADRANEKHAE